jgi:hypothetical protein
MKFNRLFFILIIIFLIRGTLSAQSVNSIVISPTHPTENDTISIISDFSYHGNCAFGLVYTYNSLIDSLIFILPTYCGYWDTSLCNSVDTFKVGPYPAGSYPVRIEYHQGSVCPISNFDATIYQLDTFVVISGTTKVNPAHNQCFQINIYPNPACDHIIISSEYFSKTDDYQLIINNIFGQQVFCCTIDQKQVYLDLSEWGGKGVYFMRILNGRYNTVNVQRIIIE